MFSNRIFTATLLISLIAHGAILCQSLNLNLGLNNDKKQKIEVSYVTELKKLQQPPKSETLKKDPFLNLSHKVTVEKTTPPPFANKERALQKSGLPQAPQITFAKPTFVKADIISIKKKITLPPVDVNKINNPSYINYYQIVREKIRRAAYQNFTRTQTGEVFVSFIISADGLLRDVQLMEEKSSADPYLRQISLRSVKDASPFPAFPKELDYPQLSFNVVISFEIE